MATAMTSLAQQPDASATITRTLFVGLAMIESTGDLLLRRLDDSDFRQSVLDPRHRSSRGKVSHAHRLVHCRSAGVNFLILVWLLQHFLYKPILNAIDAREKRIAAELADADAKKAEAQKEREDFETKTRHSMNSGASCSAKPRTRRKPSASASSTKLGKMRKACGPSKRQNCCERTKKTWVMKSPAGRERGLRNRAKGAHGSCHASLEERGGGGIHAPLANWTEGKRNPGRCSQESLRTGSPAQRLRSACRAKSSHSKCTQRDVLGGNPDPIRKIAGRNLRDRIGGQRTETGVEHRGLSQRQASTQPKDQRRCSLKRKLNRKSPEQNRRQSKNKPADGSRTRAGNTAAVKGRPARRGQMNAGRARILQTAADLRAGLFTGVRSEAREKFRAELTLHEVGIVTNVSTGIATVSAFPAWDMRNW